MKKYHTFIALPFIAYFAFIFWQVKQDDYPAVQKHRNIEKVNKPFALIEIFTSEGCSSCPPAYKVMHEVVEEGKQKNNNIWLLDFHVDYFNRAGWVDSFSKKEYTLRQAGYGDKFPEAGAYTPQMIVNGAFEGVASDDKLVNEVVKKALKSKPEAGLYLVNIKREANDSLRVTFSTTKIPEGTLINIALVQKTAVMKVLSGENSGKTLTHHNVVRNFKTVNAHGSGSTIALGGYHMPQNQVFSIVTYAQDSKTLNIIAADTLNVR